MNCRRYGSKPTLALWLFVAVIDAGLLAAAAGLVLVTVIVCSALTVLAAARLLGRRGAAVVRGRVLR
jgi:hypothetical protein